MAVTGRTHAIWPNDQGTPHTFNPLPCVGDRHPQDSRSGAIPATYCAESVPASAQEFPSFTNPFSFDSAVYDKTSFDLLLASACNVAGRR
jgi:hypothetical protein